MAGASGNSQVNISTGGGNALLNVTTYDSDGATWDGASFTHGSTQINVDTRKSGSTNDTASGTASNAGLIGFTLNLEGLGTRRRALLSLLRNTGLVQTEEDGNAQE